MKKIKTKITAEQIIKWQNGGSWPNLDFPDRVLELYRELEELYKEIGDLLNELDRKEYNESYGSPSHES